MGRRQSIVAMGLGAALAAGWLVTVASEKPTQKLQAATEAPEVALERRRTEATKTLADAKAFEIQWRQVKAKKAGDISVADFYGLRTRAADIPPDAPEKTELDAILARLGPDTQAIQSASDVAFERMAKQREAEDEKRKLAARKAYPAKAETKLLDIGHDFYLSVEGPGHRTLRVKYILMSRPMVHQLSKKADVIATWRGLGFQKVVFTDGYDRAWSLDLR